MTDETTPAPGGTDAHTPTPGDAAPTASDAQWFGGFREDLQGYAQNKGWKDPEAAVESYRNLEKLQGVPQEQLLKLPKSDAPPEAWNEVYARLGRPDQPSGYGFKVPEGADGAFSEFMANAFHEAGVPKGMAETLAEKYSAFGEQQQAQQREQQQAKVAEEERTLKTEWGAAHDQNVGMARNAAQTLGLDAATIDALEASMGYAKVMELFHSIGSKMGEGTFVAGDAPAGFGVMTPAAAKQRINALRGDTAFIGKYTAGDAGAREEMARLHKMAYPE